MPPLRLLRPFDRVSEGATALPAEGAGHCQRPRPRSHALLKPLSLEDSVERSLQGEWEAIHSITALGRLRLI